MDIVVKDANINGFQETKTRNQLSAQNARVLIGTNKEKNKPRFMTNVK